MPLVHVNAPGATHSRKKAWAAFLVFVVFPGAAAGYYFGYNVGTVTLFVTDDEIAEFAHLNITFSEIQVKSAGALTMSPWVTMPVDLQTIDLVALRDNITAKIAGARLTAGTYSHLRIVVQTAIGELKTGSNVSVEVPSGELRTDASFQVRPQSSTDLLLRLHVVQTGVEYNLRPVFAGATAL